MNLRQLVKSAAMRVGLLPPRPSRREATEQYAAALRSKGMKIGHDVGLVNVVFDTVYPFLIEIGDGCILTHATILAHDASPAVFTGRTRIGQVKILDHVFIGAGAVVLPGVTIGPRAIVGVNSVVSRDVPPNSVVAGSPAKVITSVDDWLARKEARDELIDWTGGTVPSDADVDRAKLLAMKKFRPDLLTA
ncbi:MAG: acyltransferase [Gammaproteobacteria bacterium]|nr:acyltransferase [Gammaproteobacteria bacterium]